MVEEETIESTCITQPYIPGKKRSGWASHVFAAILGQRTSHVSHAANSGIWEDMQFLINLESEEGALLISVARYGNLDIGASYVR